MKCIVAHELSRKIVTWPLYQLQALNANEFTIDVQTLMIQFPQLLLAGGALVSLMQKKEPNDWDLFVVGTVDQLNEILNYVRKRYDYYETINSISFGPSYVNSNKIPIDTNRTKNIQIIKRLYVDPSHIIGGFDLDPCRMIWINDYIWTTITGYYTIQTKSMVINPWCASSTFKHRIYKYMRKGFKEIHIYGCLIKVSAHQKKYSMPYLTFPSVIDKGDYCGYNMYMLMNMKYDKLFTNNGTIYTIDELITSAIHYYIYNDNKHKIPIIFNYNGILLKILYNWVIINSSIISINYLFPNFDKTSFITDLINKRYNHYVAITSSMIVNCHTQFTGSFYPTTADIYRIKHRIDILIKFPLLMFILSRVRMRFPRNIRILIGMYYFNTKLYKSSTKKRLKKKSYKKIYDMESF